LSAVDRRIREEFRLTDGEQAYERTAGGRGPILGMLATVTGCLLVATGGYLLIRPGAGAPAAGPQPTGPSARQAGQPVSDHGVLTFERPAGSARTLVRDSRGTVVASFTDDARTVLLAGPTRVFTEPTHTTAGVTTTAWIRLAPQEWKAGSEGESWVRPWLAKELTDTAPDVLAVATEYLQGAAEKMDDQGIRYAGDASFGPISDTDPDGRAENSDFYDYLGISWNFPDTGMVRPDPTRYGNVDCSGYIRLVYGYRLGYPLRNVNSHGPGLPRRAFAMSQFGPGVEVIPNLGVAPTRYDQLQPGDLVFFNSDPDTGQFRTDHSGIFLGIDAAGHHRFISSRSRADGPTFGDTGGAGVLDDGGYWSQRFRNARRL
jgi:cell wall-associated NlpC family hydrolase